MVEVLEVAYDGLNGGILAYDVLETSRAEALY
jgi:hypothetical protein